MILKIVLLISALLLNCVSTQDCAWDKDTDFPESYPPLLIDLSTWISIKPILDNGKRMVKVTEGKTIVVACSGTLITSLGIEVTEAVCALGVLNINGQSFDINDLACTSRIDDATSHISGNCGDNFRGSNAHIGFNVPGFPFYTIIVICFDNDIDLTLYAKHTVYGESVSAADGNPNRPSFHTDSVFYETYNPDDCYSTNAQDDYSDDLGSASYIDTSASEYFSRGHLAPNADFFTEMEADATFYFSNAVPQWQDYNGGNWANLEGDVRTLAESLNSNLEITTGPFDTLIINGDDPLDFCEDIGLNFIPTPEVVWKVIYDPNAGDALAVITSNHPHQSSNPTPICPPITCSSWLDVSFTDLSKGYTYCCTCQDLRDAVPYAPDYPIAGIL